MTASFTALAAVVVSDIAHASRAPQPELVADDVPVVPPVKMQKIAVHQPEPELLDLVEMLELKSGKGRVNFGNFEGY
jgi:hypothetical protein